MMTDSTDLHIFAIGAHPDDIEFGVGAVLLQEQSKGAEITLAITSQGEAASHGTPAKRKTEALTAAKLLGAEKRLHFLDFGGDGKQTTSPANAAHLARLIRNSRPNIVFAPLPVANQHPDHAAVGQATRDACRIARYAGFAPLRDLTAHTIDSLWFYSVAPLPERDLSAAIFIDVSDSLEAWKKLMVCHATQTSARRYVELQITTARQLGLLAGCEHAIAIWPNDPPVLSSIRPLAGAARSF
ncbi:MAG: PIG-L deacetylase family protein [Chthoniobacterales bacterium]